MISFIPKPQIRWLQSNLSTKSSSYIIPFSYFSTDPTTDILKSTLWALNLWRLAKLCRIRTRFDPLSHNTLAEESKLPVLTFTLEGGDNLQNLKLKCTHLGLCEHDDSKDICFSDFLIRSNLPPTKPKSKFLKKSLKCPFYSWRERFFTFTILSISLDLKAQFLHMICQIKAEQLIFHIKLVSCLTRPSFFLINDQK